jgi:Na+/H+ antiporter NhaD/arsenite permease-like protein
MHWLQRIATLVLVLGGLLFGPLSVAAQDDGKAYDLLTVSGVVTNQQGNGVKDAVLRLTVGGRPVTLLKQTVTDSSGTYELQLRLPHGELPAAQVELDVERPAYKASGPHLLTPILASPAGPDVAGEYIAHASVSLARAVTPALWIATVVLIAVYIFIAFELMHRTLAALVGASVILFVSYTAGTFDPAYRIITFDDAMRSIDGNVIFLLLAMMIIVGVLKRTGLFQWMAYRSFRLARGNMFVLAVLLMLVTAVVSAFLDNVTTMLLIIPVTIEIAFALKVNPIALLLPEVFASNVGGTATLIGDPPNIMIGSYAGLSFVDFATHLVLICLIGLAAAAAYFLFWFRRDYAAARVEDVPAMVVRLRREYRITDPRLLLKGGLVLLFTVSLFILHGSLHMEPSIAALAGASILLVVSGVHIVEMVEKEVEWPTLIFFMMLFIVVAGAEQTGLIQLVADWVREAARSSPVLAVLIVLWVSAILSAIVDNIPFTATMLPIVGYLSTSIPGIHGSVLWWALSLGACLGGNGTLIGASANVVTAGLAEKAGHPITFNQYLRIALLPMLLTVVLSMLWLLAVEL